MLTFICEGCGRVVEVNWDEKLKAHLDPKYPARCEIVNCKCGEYQFVIKARSTKRDKG